MSYAIALCFITEETRVIGLETILCYGYMAVGMFLLFHIVKLVRGCVDPSERSSLSNYYTTNESSDQ